jgi:hypothetical protein
MCAPPGGSNIELMGPADPTKPLSQALAKFLERRGEGFYALMLEAPDPDAEAAVLAERGLDVLPLMAGAGGRDLHPRSTHGVLIRVYPDDSAVVEPHPGGEPGLSGIAKAIIATADASLAANVYEHGLGLTAAGPAVHDEERGVLAATARAPKGGLIELVSAVDTERPFARAIAEHVKEHNGGLYALVLTAADPGGAVAALRDRGVATTALGELVVHGARIIVE